MNDFAPRQADASSPLKGHHPIRPGIKDIWNAYLVEGAKFCEFDIPLCPTTAHEPPKKIVSWEEAQRIHGQAITRKNKDYKNEAFIHFFMDDDKFDGPRMGVWANPKRALNIIKHFAGVITPDFSTYQDFPEPIKVYSTYRMRVFGFWLAQHGIAVINNVRWGTRETWRYCFAGIPKHSIIIICIGTVGGSPRKLRDRTRFNAGFDEMIEQLQPSTIVVVGSANYPCFNKARNKGIKVVAFASERSEAFAKDPLNE